MNIPLSFVREALTYDPLSGVLTWLRRPREHFANEQAWSAWNTKYAGNAAGTATIYGYLSISLTFDGQLHHIRAHRIAWALITSVWPKHEIDHRNGDRANNRWSNLRTATGAENHQNLRLYSRNTSGLPGVSWDRHRRKWCFDIQANGQRRRSRFVTREEAYAAYLAAKAELHPFQPVPREHRQ